MKFGIFIFPTDKSMDFVDLARAAEERGFESIWAPEHVHIPVELETPFPLSDDGSLPDMYTRIHDPFISECHFVVSNYLLAAGARQDHKAE